MKAAATWGSDTDVFKKGFAKETNDPKIVAATMAKPGVLLKRPVGSNGPFSENAELPQINKITETRAKTQPRRKEPTAYKVDDKTARDAALAFEREQKRREIIHRKEEAAREKERGIDSCKHSKGRRRRRTSCSRCSRWRGAHRTRRPSMEAVRS